MVSTMSPCSSLSTPQRLFLLPSRTLSTSQRSLLLPHSTQTWKPQLYQTQKVKQGLSLHASLKPDNSEEEKSFELVRKISGPVAALLVCTLLTGVVIPDEALAARSGGRIGGAAFRSMPRGGGGFRQYNYYSSPGIAPPLMGGYGYGMMPSFFFPIGFGGGFNIFITLFVISSVVNAIKGFQRRKDDEDDFDDMF